jgi:hypothetical protein
MKIVFRASQAQKKKKTRKSRKLEILNSKRFIIQKKFEIVFQ